MLRFFSIKNWSKYQHYKDRAPPWIKFHVSLLNDYAYAKLPDALKGQLNAIWLLASCFDNRLPFDAEWIGHRINATEKVDLEALERAGFIVVSAMEIDENTGKSTPSHDAGATLADCERDASPKRTEDREQKESPLSPNGDAPLTATDPAVQAIEAFNVVAAELDLPKAQAINASRRRAVTRRLRECGGIEGWFAALAKIRGSPFCQGRNNRGWRLDLDALCQPKTFTKLMEGAYDPREPKPDDNRSAARAAVFGVLHDATLRDAGPGDG